MTSQIHIVTKDQLNADNEYIGTVDLSNFDGAIEIGADLGWVKFKALVATKYIVAKAGSGIEAGWGIEAGSDIKAGWGIKAGEGIEAGWGIKAGWGIEAGLKISAKWITAKLRIFAGLCLWRIPTEEETEVAAELREGVIAFGKHVEPAKTDEPAVQS